MPPSLTPQRGGLADRRGFRGEIETDTDLFALLLRAEIEDAAEGFACEIKAKQWKKGVRRGSMPRRWFDGKHYCVFQLRGHPWTTILHEYSADTFTEQVARKLSASLRCGAVFAGSQDTAGVACYILYDSGRLGEVFFLHNERSDTFHTLTDAQFAHVEEHGFSKTPCGYFCASQVRKLSEFRCRGLCGCKSGDEAILKLNRIIDDFFKSQGAYLAFPNSEHFTLARAADDDFVRLDLIEV